MVQFAAGTGSGSQIVSMKLHRLAILLAALAATADAASITDANFAVEIGSYGEIASLKLAGDAFSTDYVMNAANSPDQNTSDHQWLGELQFKFRKGGATAWDSASTNASASARTVTRNSATKVSVHYASGSGAGTIRGFTVDETYELKDGALVWSIALANTSGQSLELGDLGLPMPFNERWAENETIYETRTVKHSFVGLHGSYLTVKRPSGIGSFLLFTPDAATGAKLEYMDHWRREEHPGSTWNQDTGNWAAGLNVYYVHSAVIKSTGRGYLPNTSLVLPAGATRTYAFKFHRPASESELRDILYREGMVDVHVAPGMIVSQGDKVHVDLHTSKAVGTFEFQHPSGSSAASAGNAATDHKLYDFSFAQLGENIVTVHYGDSSRIALQFYVIEPPGAAVQRHATFMVEKTQIQNPGVFNDKVFDDWMMDTKSRRNAFTGYQGFSYWMGWGDDWGLTHGQFLAEKSVMMPVASEIKALDEYLETAVWGSLMKGHQADFMIHDWLTTPGFTDDLVRGYAYPHVYNTFFGMYRIAKLHTDLVAPKHPAKLYLQRCFGILKALYTNSVNYNFDTGLMGELTTPEILDALETEGMSSEAAQLRGWMATKWNNFKNNTYPYGSEYNYDNTGEEAVYMLAKLNGSSDVQGKIEQKTRACRGWQPVWYQYGIPVTICGENWWQFQYTVSLAGAGMDDWMRRHSATPDLDARGVYAAKLGNFTAVNSGQMDSDPANLGTVSWTYQAEKGNLGAQVSAEGLGAQKVRTELHNGWRSMSGEADLGLFGALRIISADVANDPVFGLVGYGCDVSRGADGYDVTIKDGIGQRVNLIPLKVWISLDQDRISTISVNEAKDRIEASLVVRKSFAHVANLSVEGLAAGDYTVYVDGVPKGTFKASGIIPVKIPVALPGAATARVLVQKSSVPVSVLRSRPHVAMRRDAAGWTLSCPDAMSCPRIRILAVDGTVRSEHSFQGTQLLRIGVPSSGLGLVQAFWPDGRSELLGSMTGLR